MIATTWNELSSTFAGRAILASTAVAAIAGWLLASGPLFVAASVAVLVLVLIVSNPQIRILFVVFGGLLVFQSSADLTPQKLFFVMGAGVAVVAALDAARERSNDPSYRLVEPLFRASLVFVAVIVLSLFVAVANGTVSTAWLRDAAPYLLFAPASLFAFDAEAAFSERALRALFVAAGLTAALAFTAEWLSHRGIVSISNVIGLPSFSLGAALFAYCMAMVLDRDHDRLRWLVLASVVIGGYLITGTRSTAVLLAAPLVIVLCARRGFARRSARLAIVVPGLVLLVFIGGQLLVRTAGADREAISGRTALILHTGSSTDASYLIRLSQTESSWALFKSAPLLGRGPGYPIAWTDPSGVVSTASTVDTPVAYLSKFGLLGLIPLVVFALALMEVLRRLRQATGGDRTPAQLAIIGFGAIIVAWSFLQVPLEDKGLPSAFLLLLALALREANSMQDRTTPA